MSEPTQTKILPATITGDTSVTGPTEIGNAFDLDSTAKELVGELDTLAEQLQRPVAADPVEEEPACVQAIEAVAKLGRDAGLSMPSAPAGPALSGRLGQYELLSQVGAGGMGAVYKARHLKLDKVVALKVLPAERLRDPSAVARFEREMRAVGKLDHPHLVRATDAGEEDGVHFLVMEYVEGVDLAQLVRKVGPLPIAEACELIRQAAIGLEAARERGMVHRDVKPSNLILAEASGGRVRPEVKVLDLGLALLNDSPPGEGGELTGTGQMMGTLDYMAPEQGDRSHSVDTRADVYGLGATLYKLLTGEVVFAGARAGSPLDKLVALASQPAPSVREKRGDVPPPLAALIAKMLAKKPEDRLQTPADVARALAPFAMGADLQKILDAAAGKQSLPQPVAPAKTPPRRSIALIALGAIAAVIFAATTVFLLQTKHGTLRVEINDPDIEVAVKGTKIVLRKADDGKDVSLDVGEHQLVVSRGDLSFETKSFKIDRNGAAVVKVELLPDQVRAVQGETTLGSKSLEIAKPALNPAQANPPIAEPTRTQKEMLIGIVGSTLDTIYGTDVYTTDSHPATAAVHAGILKPGEHALVRLIFEPGRESYEGSQRNDVRSLKWGSWPRSYRIERAPQPGDSKVVEVTAAAGGPVWGSEQYTADSDLASVVIHAGLLADGETGRIKVTYLKGRGSYVGSTAHGVKSLPYVEFPLSIKVEKDRGESR